MVCWTVEGGIHENDKIRKTIQPDNRAVDKDQSLGNGFINLCTRTVLKLDENQSQV